MKNIKYALCVSAFLLYAFVCHANNTWQESFLNGRIQFTQILAETSSHRTSLLWDINQFRQTTVNLDNTLFGRAQKIQNVDITAQIRSAWSQGYTGQGIQIGILDYFSSPGARYAISLNGINTTDTLRDDITNRYIISLRRSGHVYTGVFTRQWTYAHPTNDGNFNAYLSHGEVGLAIAGGKYKDQGDTLIMGIAKDANMHRLDARFSRGTTFSARRLDFINASLSRLTPTTVMTQAYQAMDDSNIYPQGHLPVYISSAGNNHNRSASYSGIARGDRRIVNYYNAEMALSTETFDGRPLSDYLLVAGGVERTGATTYRVAGNMPGEVTELQNRWLVAPFIINTDIQTLQGTSLSAPYVTGIAGIVNSKFPEMAPADVANLLLETARDLGAPGTDSVYGRGMVDLNNALSPQQ
ncbi:MAG: S8 family serine peptidase [Desulfobacterales bacterium]|nr:S8 family serine peptidase [Desulfobacterales bacterium]